MRTHEQYADNPHRFVRIVANGDWSGPAYVTVGVSHRGGGIEFTVLATDLLAGINAPPELARDEWGRAVAFAVQRYTMLTVEAVVTHARTGLDLVVTGALDELTSHAGRHEALRRAERAAEPERIAGGRNARLMARGTATPIDLDKPR